MGRPAPRGAALAAAAVLVLTGQPVLALAQDGGPAQAPLPTVTAAQAVNALLNAGQIEQAKALLAAKRAVSPDDYDTLLQLGLVALLERRYSDAVDLFSRILARDPAAVRARLELGRAYFLQGDHANAERQFRLARAGDLPAAVTANIDVFLEAIRGARPWSSYVTLTLAPDSNLNAATTARDIDVFGLPFQLSDDARKTSGVGVSVGAGGEWAPALDRRTRLRLGAQGLVTDYPGGAFDDATLSLYAGPRWVLRAWSVSPLLTGVGRQFGGKDYSRAGGVRLETSYTPNPRTRWNANLSAQDTRFDQMPAQDGLTASLDVAYLRAVTSSSLVRGAGLIYRQEAKDPALAFTAVDLSFGYSREFKGGLSVYVEPAIGLSDYDAVQLAFGKVRHDQRARFHVDLVNRRIRYRTLMPQLSYIYSVQDSDIPLYSYHRSQVQFSLTRQF